MKNLIPVFTPPPALHHCTGWEEECKKKGKWRRQNTKYTEEYLNWVFLCDDCMKANEEHWKERWDDYYSDILVGLI